MDFPVKSTPPRAQYWKWVRLVIAGLACGETTTAILLYFLENFSPHWHMNLLEFYGGKRHFIIHWSLWMDLGFIVFIILLFQPWKSQLKVD